MTMGHNDWLYHLHLQPWNIMNVWATVQTSMIGVGIPVNHTFQAKVTHTTIADLLLIYFQFSGPFMTSHGCTGLSSNHGWDMSISSFFQLHIIQSAKEDHWFHMHASTLLREDSNFKASWIEVRDLYQVFIHDKRHCMDGYSKVSWAMITHPIILLSYLCYTYT